MILGSKLIFQLKADWKSTKKLAWFVIWEKQLKVSWKYFWEAEKNLACIVIDRIWQKCLQKATKKADFDLAWFVNSESAQKMSNCTLFDIFCRYGENLEICRKALFDAFSAECSIFNFSHDFWDFPNMSNRQSYELFSKIDPQVQLDAPKRLQKFPKNHQKNIFLFFFW